jgi:hypothetical protein
MLPRAVWRRCWCCLDSKAVKPVSSEDGLLLFKTGVVRMRTKGAKSGESEHTSLKKTEQPMRTLEKNKV